MTSKYESHVLPRLDEIGAWCRDGVSEEKIAENLGISYSCFRDYKEKHSALSAVLKKNKDYVDNVEVVGALMKMVTGYTVTLHKTRMSWNPENKCWDELHETWEQHIPPNPGLMQWWLKLRQRDAWHEPDVVQDQEEPAIMVLPEREQMEGGDDLGARDMGTTA